MSFFGGDWKYGGRRLSRRLTTDAAGLLTDGSGEIAWVPRITIAVTALLKIATYIDLYPKEISGLGSVKVLEEGRRFHIEDVFLLEQTDNTDVHTDLTDGAAKLAGELLERDIATDNLRFWWHSHVNMQAQWSGQDDFTATNFGEDFLISLVGNKRGEYRVRLDLCKPIRVVLDNLPLIVDFTPPDDFVERCADDIRAHVKGSTLWTMPTRSETSLLSGAGSYTKKDLAPPPSVVVVDEAPPSVSYPALVKQPEIVLPKPPVVEERPREAGGLFSMLRDVGSRLLGGDDAKPSEAAAASMAAAPSDSSAEEGAPVSVTEPQASPPEPEKKPEGGDGNG